MNCPHCGKRISPELVKSEAARLASRKRQVHAGGRPRSDAPRCPCGASTFARARSRSFDCCRKAGLKPSTMD
jgi:hypothetical protein